MSDPVIENAVQAANTPANQAPDERAASAQDPAEAEQRRQEPARAEQRRQAISREPDFWKDGPKTAALRAEMKKLATPPDVLAAENQKKTEADAALSPAEQRVKKANADPALFNPKDPRHDEARRELRLALADAATDYEKQAWANTPLKEKREVFNLPEPPLPASQQQEYVEQYGAWEGDFIGLAQGEGLTGQQVRGLRDEALQLGMLVAERGKPASDEDLKRLLDKYNVPVASREALTRLWRHIESGSGSS